MLPRRFHTSLSWTRWLFVLSSSMTFLFLFYGTLTFRHDPSQQEQLELWSGRKISAMPNKLNQQGEPRSNSLLQSDSQEVEHVQKIVSQSFPTPPRLLTTTTQRLAFVNSTPKSEPITKPTSSSSSKIFIVWARDGSQQTSLGPSTSNSLPDPTKVPASSTTSSVPPPPPNPSSTTYSHNMSTSAISAMPQLQKSLSLTSTKVLLSPKQLLDQKRESLKVQMQSFGFVVGSAALVPANTTTLNQQMNRTVTKDDIKRTLGILSRRLNDSRWQLKSEVPHQFSWSSKEPTVLLIVTTWRSGSTFLGHILTSHPGVFNHYEPLMHVGIKQVRQGPEVDDSLQLITQLTQCKYTHSKYLQQVAQNVGDMVGHNAHVWESCLAGPNRLTCTNATFLDQACKTFPYQTMKLVRLRLNFTEPLLQLPRLKILYLVRDPRGTLNSRSNSVKWCTQSADCIQASRLCEDITSDLNAFERFALQFPGRVALIKYETLATIPQRAFKSVFDFAGLHFTHQLQEMVAKHTSRNEDQPWSITRKSSERVNLWQQKLTPTKIKDTEYVCRDVIKRLGYKLTS